MERERERDGDLRMNLKRKCVLVCVGEKTCQEKNQNLRYDDRRITCRHYLHLLIVFIYLPLSLYYLQEFCKTRYRNYVSAYLVIGLHYNDDKPVNNLGGRIKNL